MISWSLVSITPSPFTSFHLMVALGMFFIALNGFGTLLLFKDWLFKARWFLLILVLSIPLPVIACQLGWITTEVGRQPWIVYGVMKTSNAASGNVEAWEVIISIILFGLLYLIITSFYIYLIITQIKQGPISLNEEELRY